MPKEITHWILAERAAQRLTGSRLADIISRHHLAYLGGAVLPDTLLHLVCGPNSATALKLADDFHDSRGNSFQPLVEAEARYDGTLPQHLMACLLGVVSHMQTDMVFHPYVYALSGVESIGRHYRLETALDIYFLRRGARPPLRHLACAAPPSLVPLLTDAMALLFDPRGRLHRRTLEQTLALHCRIQGMYDAVPWKLAALLLATLPGSPVREQAQLFYPLRGDASDHLAMINSVGSWRHPVTDIASITTPDGLAGEAVDRTTAIFRQVEQAGCLADALPPGANLLTGLYGVGKTNMNNRTEQENRT